MRILQALLDIDKENEYRLFFNSFSQVDFPKFKNDNIKIASTRIPNKFFNLPLQKVLKQPKIDKKLDADIFWQPNIGFIALSKSCKKVLTIHDLSFLRYPHFFSLKMQAWHKLVNVRDQVAKADKIIAVSQSTKNDLVELLHARPEKVEVVHSGVDENMAFVNREISDKVAKKYDLPENYFLTLSTLEPRKNIEGIINAFDNFVDRTGERSHSLLIAGGKGWKFNQIFEEYEKAKNKELIKFVGYVKDKEKPALYSRAKAFVYASHYEGFGFPPLEALSCHCPVIMSANSSLPEICGEQATLVRANKSSEISRALELALLQDKTENKKEEVAKKIKNKYKWQSSAKQHLEIFNKLV